VKILTSFRRFAVIGSNQPTAPDEELLARLQEHALRVADLGTPEPIEYGWCGGAHIEDGEFTFMNNVFNDCLLFALRIDTNKVPAEVRKAYQLLEETAIAKDNPSGFISKKQRSEVKETIKRKVEDDLRSGKYRRSKLVPILWDLSNRTIYTPAAGSAQEDLVEIFRRTFDLELVPLTAGALTVHAGVNQGSIHDAKPTRFVLGPGGESQWPDYPWVLKSPEPKDFLGNEFLLWLWYQESVSKIPDGWSVMLCHAIELDCAYGESGRDVLRSVGVALMPEAMKALQAGKMPRKCGLMMEADGSQYSFCLQAETFAIGSLKLPEVEEADSPRTLLEEQITQLREFSKSIDQLYAAFLRERTSSAWASRRDAIRTWIQNGGK
jgi:hypothetical protein